MTAARILYGIIFLFILPSCRAQDKKPVPLKSVLETISKAHDINFSYIEDEIIVYSLENPPENWSLRKKITYIESETRLRIKAINRNYYTVYNDRRMDKPLCGYLADAESGNPIENAAVTIFSASINMSSDSSGYFEIPKISPDSITVTHQGYQGIRISPEDLYLGNCVTFRLKPITKSLDEVVTNRILATGISKARSGSYRVRPAKFGILPGLTEPDVLQTMQQIPGIYSADETISNLNVRGGTHDQNLFLWNGVRMFQTGHFFGLISGFNPTLAQSITITKNGSSAFYGDSVSSVVDISSQDNRGEKSGSSLGSNMINAQAHSIVRMSENASLIVSGRKSITEFVESPTYRNFRNRIFQNTVVTNFGSNDNGIDTAENFRFYDFTVQYAHKFGDILLNADVIRIANSLDARQTDGSSTTESTLAQESTGANISIKKTWNEKSTIAFSSYASHYRLDGTSQSLFSGQFLEQENAVLNLGATMRVESMLAKNLQFAAGYQFDELGVTNADQINNPAFERDVKEVLRHHAVISEALYHSGSNKIYLKGGIRLNYFDKFKLLLPEPRLQLNYRISDKWQLELLAERKSQSLSQVIDRQQDFLGIEKRRWVLSDEDAVPIQKSSQASIGFTYKDSGWLFTIDNFYKLVDGITAGSQGFQNQFEEVRSTGEYRIIGTEILLQKQFNRFYTWLSYSWNDNFYHFENLQPESFPNNFEIRHSISWAAIYEWNTIKIALGAKWQTGRPYTAADFDNGSIIFGKPNGENLPDYFQVNFSASKNWQITDKMDLETGFSLLNITDTQNTINRFYSADASGNLQQIDTYSLEMTPNVNIKAIF